MRCVSMFAIQEMADKAYVSAPYVYFISKSKSKGLLGYQPNGTVLIYTPGRGGERHYESNQKLL